MKSPKILASCRSRVYSIWPFSRPTFPIPISNVFKLSAKKKMVGIYTGRVVALMQNLQIVSDLTAVQGPRHTMSTKNAPSNIFTNAAVPISASCRDPEPTPTIGFWNVFFLKSLSNRLMRRHDYTIPSTARIAACSVA
jgi:hypothetical protein